MIEFPPTTKPQSGTRLLGRFAPGRLVTAAASVRSTAIHHRNATTALGLPLSTREGAE
jgi:hypothetical protein